MNEYQRAADYLDNRYKTIQMKLPYSIEEVDSYILNFQKNYAPEKLLEISKPDILPKLFLSDSKKSMMYEIMREDKCVSGWLGHVGSQYINNFPFRKSGNNVKVGRGMPKWADDVIEYNKAVEYAYDFRNRFVEGILYLRSHNLETLYDYESFGKYLKSQIGSQAEHGWVHKYLHLMYPDLFTEFHIASYRPNSLKILGVEPIKSFYGSAWQWTEIRRHMQLNHMFLIANTLYNDSHFEKLEGKKLKDIVSIFDEDTSTEETDNSHNVEQPTKTKKIISQEYGNWCLWGSNKMILDVSYDDTCQDTFAVPREVFETIANGGKTDDIELELNIANESFVAIIQQDSHGDASILFDETFISEIMQRSQEWQTGVMVVFSKESNQCYSVDFKNGLKREIAPVSKMEIEDSEKDDDRLTREFNNSSIPDNRFENYIPVPEDRPQELIKQTGTSKKPYPRDPVKKAQALARAQYRCELDRTHSSFVSKSTGKFYMETHHLIPVEFWQSFKKNLDVLANIVCLCSNCHNEIHYGVDAERLIKSLYEERKDELSKAQIGISEELLLKMYSGELVKGEKVE